MKNKDSHKMSTFLIFIKSGVHYGLCFFVFIFLINNVIIELLTSGNIDLSKKSLTYLSVASSIVGIASGARITLFAKLDERKTKKPPRSGSE